MYHTSDIFMLFQPDWFKAATCSSWNTSFWVLLNTALPSLVFNTVATCGRTHSRQAGAKFSGFLHNTVLIGAFDVMSTQPLLTSHFSCCFYANMWIFEVIFSITHGSYTDLFYSMVRTRMHLGSSFLANARAFLHSSRVSLQHRVHFPSNGPTSPIPH